MNNNYEYTTNYQHLLELADSMAQAATTFNGQGYYSFLQASEDFQHALYQALQQD